MMTSNQEVFIMAFGVVVAAAGLVLLFSRGKEGKNLIKFFGQEFELSTPGLVVLIVGCGFVLLPVLPVFESTSPTEHVPAYAHENLRDLALKELGAKKPYYTEHNTTYTIASLDEEKETIVFEIEARGTLRNEGSAPYEGYIQIITHKSLKKPWAKVNGHKLTPKPSRRGTTEELADFGKVIVPPHESRYLERGFQTFSPFPVRAPDMLANPSLKSSLTIRVTEHLASTLHIEVRPLFDRSFLKGPEVTTDDGYENHKWWSRGTALFPYQGFFMMINKKGSS